MPAATLRRGNPSRNPIINCRLPALSACVQSGTRPVHRVPDSTAETLAGIAQTGGNPRHRHQQRLLHRAALLDILLPRTGQQFGLQ